MRVIYIVYSIVMMAGLVACKKDAGNIQEEAPQNTPAVSADSVVNKPVRQASDAAGASGHDYTFLTDRICLFADAVTGSKEGESPYKDQWIDFSADGTFKAGKKKEQTHTGTWTYNHDTKVLFLKPDVNTFKMSEWRVKYSDQMMVWVGTTTYGNNSIQIRLVKSDQLP